MVKKAQGWHLDIDRYLNRVVPASPLHKLPTPVSRFLGYRKEQKQDVGNILGAFWSMLGAFCGLAVVAAVFNNTESIQRHAPPALIASFVSGIICCHCTSLRIYAGCISNPRVQRSPLTSWTTTQCAARPYILCPDRCRHLQALSIPLRL